MLEKRVERSVDAVRNSDSRLQREPPNHTLQTIEFLKRLLMYPIQYIKVTKGDKIVREEYFSLMEDGKKDSLAGPSGPLFARNLFTRKVTEVSYWKYDKETNDFISCTLEQLGFDANTVFTKILF